MRTKERTRRKNTRRKKFEILLSITGISFLICLPSLSGTETPQSTENKADVPVWEVGDTWTYEERCCEFTYYPDGGLYFRFFQNCTITYLVTAIEEDYYVVKMTSQNIHGSLAIARFHWTLPTSLTDSKVLHLRKIDLAELYHTYDAKGLMFLYVGRFPIPIPAQFQVSEEEQCSPPMTLLPFPLIPQTKGTLPSINHRGYYRLSLYWGVFPLLNNPDYWYNTGPCTYACTLKSITVPLDTYTAYNVSVTLASGGTHDCWRSYYATRVGNIVKQSIYLNWHGTELPYCIKDLTLLSTTYTP